jgi:hypothetical protein
MPVQFPAGRGPPPRYPQNKTFDLTQLTPSPSPSTLAVRAKT